MRLSTTEWEKEDHYPEFCLCTPDDKRFVACMVTMVATQTTWLDKSYM
jgi:hypothetical protein